MAEHTEAGLSRYCLQLTVLLASCLVLTLRPPAGLTQTGEVDSFRISQVVAIHPDFKVFLEVLDANGNMAKDVSTHNLSALLGSRPLQIQRVKVFDPLEQGIAYIFLVDISRSLTAREFAAMKQVLQTWVNNLGSLDRAALITFGTEVKTVLDFTADKAALASAMAQLKPTDNDTQLHKGLARALELGSRADPALPPRRIILTLSDGQDDFAGGMTKEELLQRLRVEPIPIYAIGYYPPPRTLPKEEGLKALGVLARTSGGVYVRADNKNFAETFALMQRHIREVYQVEINWPPGSWEGAVQNLQMTYMAGPKVLTANMDMRLRAALPLPTSVRPQLPPQPPLTFWRLYPLGYIGLGLLALGVLSAALFLAFREKEAPAPVAETGNYSDLAPGGNIGTATVPLGSGNLTRGLVGPAYRPIQTAGANKTLRFTVIRGQTDQPSYEVPLKERLIIGRANDCDLALADDKEVSRHHCELTWEQGKVKIADLGSQNGTFLNGVPISTTYTLANDDVIQVGRTKLRVTIL